ncbi:hypothetical protein AVEN_195336-1, partial [Araneus ventricosus]
WEMPMSCVKQNFAKCLVDWLQANFGNDVMDESPSISNIPNHLPGGHHPLTQDCFDGNIIRTQVDIKYGKSLKSRGRMF